MTTAALPRTALAAFSLDSARDFACDVLRAAGIVSVTPARDGREARPSAPVDVIVTDWPAGTVPLGDFVRGLREANNADNDAERLTPVVLLTARDGRADLDAARRAGVSAVVVKPVSPALLKHRLAALSTNALRRSA
jgi:CheY-like chemotaxis protein